LVGISGRREKIDWTVSKGTNLTRQKDEPEIAHIGKSLNWPTAITNGGKDAISRYERET
jgi:hypothetical protein